MVNDFIYQKDGHIRAIPFASLLLIISQKSICKYKLCQKKTKVKPLVQHDETQQQTTKQIINMSESGQCVAKRFCYLWLLQDFRPKNNLLKYRLLENFALLATKAKPNVEKALSQFMEISTAEVSWVVVKPFFCYACLESKSNDAFSVTPVEE